MMTLLCISDIKQYIIKKKIKIKQELHKIFWELESYEANKDDRGREFRTWIRRPGCIRGVYFTIMVWLCRKLDFSLISWRFLGGSVDICCNKQSNWYKQHLIWVCHHLSSQTWVSRHCNKKKKIKKWLGVVFECDTGLFLSFMSILLKHFLSGSSEPLT